jgi:hypothetical protein
MDEINTALIQTRIPPETLAAAMNAATLDGISLAAWLRRLIAKELGRDGLGKRIKVTR